MSLSKIQPDTTYLDAGSRLWFTPELQILILKEAWQGPTAEYRPFTPASNGILACILRTCSYSFDIASALLYEREPTIWADLLDHEERIRESWNKSGLRGHQARTRMSDSRLHYYIGLVKKFSVARYRYPDLATLKGPLLKRFTLYHNAEQADFNMSPDCAVTVTRDTHSGTLKVVHLRKWLDSPPTLKAQSELLCTIPGMRSCQPRWLELYREETNLLSIPPQLEFDTAADLYSKIECLVMDGMRLPYSDLTTLRKLTPFLTKLDVSCSPPDDGEKITLDHINWPLLRSLSFKANLNQWNFDLETTIDGLVQRNPSLRFLSFPMALPRPAPSRCLIPTPPSLSTARWPKLLELNLSIKAETDADRPLIATTYFLSKLISRQCVLTFSPNTLAFPPPGSFDTWNRAGIERAVYWGHTIVSLRREYMEYLWQEKMEELTKIPGWRHEGAKAVQEEEKKEVEVAAEDNEE